MPSAAPALVIAEATAVQANGRISPHDLGIWQDAHVDALARIAHFVHAPGQRRRHPARARRTQGQQPSALGGPGRRSRRTQGGWLDVVAPSAIPFSDTYPQPHALTTDGIAAIVEAFADAATRAWDAGFRVIELHGAHGYLLHEFLSPISNIREDEYGGTFENRCRLTLEVVRAIRGRWPERAPLFVRLSATDWVEGGWDIEECVDLAKRLAAEGVDLIDCSSGGNASHQRIPVGPGYQVPFASRIRRDAGVLTGAVGMITEPAQADGSSPTGTPTPCCWRARCCAIHGGRCTPPRRWATRCPGPRSTCAPPQARRVPASQEHGLGRTPTRTLRTDGRDE